MSAPESFDSLAAELKAAFGEGVAAPWPEERFDALARRVFTWQWSHNPVYRRFCERRGRRPETIEGWREIPAVPASAFKVLDLAPEPVEVRFRTSGTREGREVRGQHGIRSLDLYRASVLPPLQAALAPEGVPLRVLSLIPPADAVPDSSLARMIAFATEAFGDGRGASFAEADFSLDLAGFVRAARRAVDEGVVVWVAGTAFAFVHLIDAVAEGAVPAVALPPGSRVMETGGFKGRTRSITPSALHAGIGQALGVPSEWIVNEYGMTELLSQFYDGVAGATPRPPAGERLHRAPPWLRTRVVDPVTLEAVPPGAPGLLVHFDLANLGSVSALLTEDVGVSAVGGRGAGGGGAAGGDGAGAIRLLGRAAGAEPRGCSLTLEELLTARGGGAS